MKKNLKIILSIIFVLAFIIPLSLIKVKAEDTEETPVSQIVTPESDSVGIGFVENENTMFYNNLYIFRAPSLLLDYEFIGTAYDETHTYSIELADEASVGAVTAYAPLDYAVEYLHEPYAKTISYNAKQNGYYELELTITDETTATKYYQKIPYYAEVTDDYAILLTGGKKYMVETKTEEDVVFEVPYVMNNEVFELGERFFTSASSTGVDANTFTTLNFEIIMFDKNDSLTNLIISTDADSHMTVEKLADINKFNITWVWEGSSRQIVSHQIQLYLEYTNSETGETTGGIQGFELTRNIETATNYYIHFTVTKSASSLDSTSLGIQNEKQQRYHYDFFLLNEQRKFTIDDLKTYEYISLFNIKNKSFIFDDKTEFYLNVVNLFEVLQYLTPADGLYYLYVVAKDVKGTPIGIECIPLSYEFTQEETDNINIVTSKIRDLNSLLGNVLPVNYHNYSEYFNEIDTYLSSLDPKTYSAIEGYEQYAENYKLYVYSYTLVDLEERIRNINWYERNNYINIDGRIVDIYEIYTSLPLSFKNELSRPEVISMIEEYLKCRNDLLLLRDAANSYEIDTEIIYEDAYRLYSQYTSLGTDSSKFLPSYITAILNNARDAVEQSITGISFESGEQVNLLLNDDVPSVYFLSLDQAFVRANLECQWMILGDTIFEYETSNQGITLYPTRVGECKILVYYYTLDYELYSDEIKVVVLEDKIEANVVITKETEGAYTIYDTLSFQVQLTYNIVFSDTATFEWSINGEEVFTTASFDYRFTVADNYTIECLINDATNGIENIKASRNIRIISVSDADFNLTMTYEDKIYAYLGGSEIIIEALLDEYLNNDYTYEWRILDETIVRFFLQNPTGPQIALEPLKDGITSVVVMVDVGKYQSKILMCSLEIEIISTIESIQLYREDTGLKPNSRVSYRASINNIPNVVNLAVDFTVDYAEDDQFSPAEISENMLILDNLRKGKYKVNATIDGKSTNDTFRIQTIAIDQILFSALPVIAFIAFALLAVKLIYDKKRARLLVLFEKITLIQNQMIALKEKIADNTYQHKTQKVVLKNLRRWQHQLSSLFILTKNLSIQENLELEIAEKHFMDILFIVEAGLKTFKLKFIESTVQIYFDKLTSNNFKELLTIIEQKVRTVALQHDKEKEDSFLAQEKEVEKEKAERKKLSPKQYADYLRKIHYYDADDLDDNN